jgi:hypothetical protein
MFDRRLFRHINLFEDKPKREPIEDDPGLPLGPWCHHPLCDSVLRRPAAE